MTIDEAELHRKIVNISNDEKTQIWVRENDKTEELKAEQSEKVPSSYDFVNWPGPVKTPDLAPKNNTLEGKARPTLLPFDLLIKYATPAYEEGVKKYVRESWRKGFKTSVMIDAMLRHIVKFYWDGEDWDIDAAQNTGIKKHHLGAVIFCCCSILNCFDSRPELDDRPNGADPNNELMTDAEIEAFVANQVFKRKSP